MYNDYNYFIKEGWRCPQCHKIYSPFIGFCPNCNGGTKTTSSTTAMPEWIYKEDTSKGTAAPNNWWDTYINTTLADALSNLNIYYGGKNE